MNNQLKSILQKAVKAFQDNNLELAKSFLHEALKANHLDAEAIFDLGIVYAEANRFSEALLIFHCLKSYKDKDPRIPFNIGLIYSLQGEHKLSLDAYDLALKLQPNNAEALINKAAIYNEIKEFSLALVALDYAIQLNENYYEAYLNKGNSLRALKRYDDAIAHYDKALNLKPDCHEAWVNKGVTLHELKRYDDAIAHYDRALNLKPDYHEAFWNKSLSLLVQGNFKDGLPLYESRWIANRTIGVSSNHFLDRPLWVGGEPLQGKTILLYGEQGFGDFIQFCRYVKLVADLGAKVILETPEPLKKLMATLDGVSQLVTKGEKNIACDYRCPLLSLPLAFKTDLSSIPRANKYIAFDNASTKILEWEQRLGVGTGPRIGLAWRGNPGHQNDASRSLTLEQLLSHLPKKYEYISLQKEVREEDRLILESSPDISSFESSLSDFSDTAALIECMDLVITIDTSVAHLSGALGKKTWVLLPHSPDWRWLLDRSDSPWYSSMKLYRQSISQDWREVLNNVESDLLALT